jgi:hypothetical protein
VSKHFHQIVKTNRVFFRELTIKAKTSDECLVMMRVRVKGCDQLNLHVPPQEEMRSFQETALEELLQHLAETVTMVKCRTGNPLPVKKFLNQCHGLKKLELDTTTVRYYWDWARHQQPLPSVQELFLIQPDWGLRTLMETLTIFPTLKVFREKLSHPPMEQDEIPSGDPIWKRVAVNHVQRYKAPRLLPEPYLDQMQRVGLTLWSVPQAQRLTRYLVHMPLVQSVTLLVSNELVRNHVDILTQLVQEIGNRESIRRVGMRRYQGEPGEAVADKLDETVRRELRKLPSHVASIHYQQQRIRPEEEEESQGK